MDLKPGEQVKTSQGAGYDGGARGQGSAAVSVCGRVENSPRPSLYAGPASHETRGLSLAGLQLPPGEQHRHCERTLYGRCQYS